MATGNQCKHLEFTLALSQRLFSLLNYRWCTHYDRVALWSVKLEKHSHRHFSQHIGYSELENVRRIDILVHVTCYPETMPMSRIMKKPCSIFKTKQSTERKTGQQIFV